MKYPLNNEDVAFHFCVDLKRRYCVAKGGVAGCWIFMDDIVVLRHTNHMREYLRV